MKIHKTVATRAAPQDPLAGLRGPTVAAGCWVACLRRRAVKMPRGRHDSPFREWLQGSVHAGSMCIAAMPCRRNCFNLVLFFLFIPFIFVLTPPGVGLCARHPDPEKKGGQLHQRVGLPFGGANHVPVYVGASYSAP